MEQGLRQARLARGWSQAELARSAGLTRQSINAIEGDRYLPNTGVALRLARALGRRVEDLFALEGPEEAGEVRLAGGLAQEGDRVAVALMRDHLVAHRLDGPGGAIEGFWAADGTVITGGAPPKRGVAGLRLLVSRGRIERTALLLGCDPSLGILADHVSSAGAGVYLRCVQSASRRALSALALGEAHAVGSHLWDPAANDYNIGPATRALWRTGGIAICLAEWEQGFVVAPGNPGGIRGAADLARSGVTLVNREPGAGSRELLDMLLAEERIPATRVSGYGHVVHSHLAVARAVAGGTADAGIALRAAARANGLDFVPVSQVRFDIVVPRDQTRHPAVTVLLDTLQSGRLREELRTLPGYDTTRTGSVVLDVEAGR